MVKSTGKLIQCIQRIARGCFLSRRMLGDIGTLGVSTAAGGAGFNTTGSFSADFGDAGLSPSAVGWPSGIGPLLFSCSSMMIHALVTAFARKGYEARLVFSRERSFMFRRICTA